MINQSYFTNFLLKKLKQHEKSIKKKWALPEGTTTRYFYIDDLLPKDICKKIYDAFPKNAEGFFDRESFREKKRLLRT